MSATHDVLRIIELVSARFYRSYDDVIGSVNGPSTSASIRLRHAAWEPNESSLPLAQMVALAKGLPRQIGLDISTIEPNTVFPAITSRILLNLLLLAADSLPAGGDVVMAGSADDLFLQISGPGTTAWPAGLALCIADEAAARAALADDKSLQMAITTLLAHVSGIRLSLVMSPSRQDQPSILRLGGN